VLEPVEAWRVVASPAALDAAQWDGDAVDVIRIAPDEALGLGATGARVDGDPDAIIEREGGYAVAFVAADELATIAAHADWPLPGGPGTLAQGKLAGVAAKLLIGDPTLLLVQVAYADDLERRLGWR
jgi:hypothetical protein